MYITVDFFYMLQINPSKKIWDVGDDPNKSGDVNKPGIFTSHPWTTRDDNLVGPTGKVPQLGTLPRIPQIRYVVVNGH